MIYKEAKEGDWVVLRDGSRIEAHCALRITDECISVADKFRRTGKTRIYRKYVVFAGPENIARRLAEQLKSSYALHSEERQACYTRHVKRDEQFIEKATELALALAA